jgi:inner membrane protein
MEGRTHLAFGLAAGVGLACASKNTDDVASLTLTIAVAAFGALLPDIDEDGSLINNYIFPFTRRRSIRSFILATLGVVAVLLWFLKNLPLWVLLAGIFAAAVAYVPHRTVTHSLLALGYVTAMMHFAAPSYTYAMMLGYASHLLADSFTKAGVPLLWPYSVKFNFKKLGIQVKSGGGVDRVIGSITLVLSALGFVYLLGHIFYDQAVTAGWLER